MGALRLGLATVLFVVACSDSPTPAGTDGGGSDGGGSDGGAVDSGLRDGGSDGAAACATPADCDDGTFCNGVELCTPGGAGADARGCVSPGTPCMPMQTCDETANACVTVCAVERDADGDGSEAMACGGLDCDDADPMRAPGRPEICDTVNRDEDCDAATFGDRDRDRDGDVDAACCNDDGTGTLVCGPDCDDVRRGVYPGASEVCNDLDDDCDGAVDETVRVSGFADDDHDLHGDGAVPREGCAGDASLSPVGDDCDDTDPSRHRGQLEICDGIDNDCDGAVDDGAGAVTWYRDLDSDGHGSAASGTVMSCAPPAGHRLLGSDCDDADPQVFPGAAERCNALDDDCDGSADFEVGPSDLEDDDADGVPDDACATSGGDCDDRDPTARPGAAEIRDGVDNDCDGTVDDGSCAALDWLVDADGDGWGDSTMAAMSSCDPIAGRTTRGGDCDDAEPLSFPGNVEYCNDLDDDCDSMTDEGSSRYCFLPRALGLCTAGGCDVGLCDYAWENCDGADPNGCEANTLGTDALNCGICGTICFGGPRALPICNAGTCDLMCSEGYDDCDGVLANGCEVDIYTTTTHCGRCGNVCSARPQSVGACAAGLCGITCDAGWADCDGALTNGCETQTDRDAANCGGCGVACPVSTDICIEGSCVAPPFPSDGSDGALVVAAGATVRLPAGVYHYTTITVATGGTLLADGTGVLELYASGDVIVDGAIDVSGGAGGRSYADVGTTGSCGSATGGDGPGAGGGGSSGTRVTGADGTLTACGAVGPGGAGVVGATGTGNLRAICGAGGSFGGGVGGLNASAGGGGGGVAGGGGGGARNESSTRFTTGGRGATSPGLGTGGTGGSCGATPVPAHGGDFGLAVYAGGDGTIDSGSNPSWSWCCGGGGGGSIGAASSADLAVSPATFLPGSGGGGGGGCGCCPSFACGNPTYAGNGGGGGGGALRIASATRLVVNGTVAARGGAGGSTRADNGRSRGGGGGGSGGVIYLSAPSISGTGTVSAAGGLGGNQYFGVVAGAARGGNGGPGRIRLSTLVEECSLTGTVSPALVSGCTPTPAPGTPNRAFVARFPN